MKHICGIEMHDMGEWPDKNMKIVVHKFHCRACKEFIDVPVPGFKVIKLDDTHYEMVPAE